MNLKIALLMLWVTACGFADLKAAEAPGAAAPGLKLTLESGVAKDVKVSRLLALRVPEKSAVSPFVAAGPFKATWDSEITLRIRDENVFSAAGRGALKLTINDQVVLDVSGDDLSIKKSEPIKLKKGKNVVHAEYESPKTGEAWVRVFWSSSSFLSESLSPLVLTHEPEDAELSKQNELRVGRELAANLRCVKCHTADVATSVTAMPELGADTPSLVGVGQRYTQAWLAHWINNPHAIRPDTEMPRVFSTAGEQIDPRARDIAAYLVDSSAKTQAGGDDDSPEAVIKGTRLFTGFGCIACHILPGQTAAPDAPTRVSLAYAKAKFQPGALKAFLQKPEAHYQWRRMPNFRLSDEEAAALAAFVRSRGNEELKGDTTGDAKRGQELFQSSGCLNCHTDKLPSTFKVATLAEVSKSDFAKGCMAKSADARGKAPEYSLTDEQRAALASLAKTQFASLAQDSAAEFASRQIAQLNCTACHVRDKTDDTFSQLNAEVEALVSKLPEEKSSEEFGGDQSRPPLTWAGEKLHPEWMAQFIAGQVKYKPRPWLMARMPGFPARAKLLATGLAQEHGCASTSPAPTAPDAELAKAGMKLVSKNGGFACIQCHSVADMRALAPFEAPAINFAHVTERLTKEFYDRWVYNPQRVLPGTRMPQFADTEGKTALKDSFGGDARKQYDAIWNYLQAGEKITPPPMQ